MGQCRTQDCLALFVGDRVAVASSTACNFKTRHTPEAHSCKLTLSTCLRCIGSQPFIRVLLSLAQLGLISATAGWLRVHLLVV